MIVFLADHDAEGQAKLIFGALNADGWLDLLPLRLKTFSDVELEHDSSDRVVWHACQQHAMVLLTANRTMDEVDSLEAVLRAESSADTWPVITIADPQRVIEPDYLERCVLRLVEIAIDLERLRGSGRLYIP